MIFYVYFGFQKKKILTISTWKGTFACKTVIFFGCLTMTLIRLSYFGRCQDALCLDLTCNLTLTQMQNLNLIIILAIILKVSQIILAIIACITGHIFLNIVTLPLQSLLSATCCQTSVLNQVRQVVQESHFRGSASLNILCLDKLDPNVALGLLVDQHMEVVLDYAMTTFNGDAASWTKLLQLVLVVAKEMWMDETRKENPVVLQTLKGDDLEVSIVGIGRVGSYQVLVD